MLDVQKTQDAILRAIIAFEKAKENTEFNWNKPIAADILDLMLSQLKQNAIGLIEGGYENG